MSEIDLNEQLRDLRRRVSNLERKEIPIGLSTLHWHAALSGGSAFLAYLGNDANNVTGDGTIYTVICDTEVFDTGGDYDAGAGIFTAPATGVYLLGATARLSGTLSAHVRGSIRIVTSNATFAAQTLNPYACMDSDTQLGLTMTTLADMDVADTAYMAVRVRDGTKVVDVLSSETNTWFWGLRVL